MFLPKFYRLLRNFKVVKSRELNFYNRISLETLCNKEIKKGTHILNSDDNKTVTYLLTYFKSLLIPYQQIFCYIL